MKKTILGIISTLLIACTAVSLVGCGAKTDKKYFDTVSAYSFWDNNGSESIAQYKLYEVMDKFLSSGTIENGKSISADGKTRKVLFVGWDGVRADAIANIFYDENNKNTNLYNYEAATYSGLHKLKQNGGLYMAYAGGEKGKDSQQHSSTCAGWTSILTGGWNTLHGVVSNNDVKKADVDTIIMKYAKLGLNTGLAFDWGQLFDLTYKEEIKQKLANPQLPVKYCDIDRSKVDNINGIMRNEGIKDSSKVFAESIELYNETAIDGPKHTYATYDVAMRDYLFNRIAQDDDIVAGIFHNPDSNGHTDGFSNNNGHYVNSVRSANLYLYELIIAIEEREKLYDEEWLVIATTDHGGSARDHGSQVYEHRTTWVASNRPLVDLFAHNYDGFVEN